MSQSQLSIPMSRQIWSSGCRYTIEPFIEDNFKGYFNIAPDLKLTYVTGSDTKELRLFRKEETCDYSATTNFQQCNLSPFTKVVTYECDHARAKIALPSNDLFLLEVNGIRLLSNNLIYDEHWPLGPLRFSRAVWASTDFSDGESNILRDGFHEFQARCGGPGFDNAYQRIEEAKRLRNLPPDLSTSTNARSWDNIWYILALLAGPGPIANSRPGNRSLVINAFDDNSTHFGLANEGEVAVTSRGDSLDPFTREVTISCNKHHLSGNPDRRLWANVIAHEVIHQFFALDRGVDHKRYDFVYATGDAVQGSAGLTWICGCGS